MNSKHLTISTLAAILALGAAATPSLARNMGDTRPDRGFIYLLKTSDANKDGKITEDEIVAFQDGRFEAIDVNGDGVITPGEFSDYRKAQLQAFLKANPRPDSKMAARNRAPGTPGPNGKMASQMPDPNGNANGKMAARDNMKGKPGPDGKVAAGQMTTTQRPGPDGTPGGKMAARDDMNGKPSPNARMANSEGGPDGMMQGKHRQMSMNGDGAQHQINGNRAQQAMDGQGKNGGKWGGRPGNVERIFFVRADTDHSGQVSQQEFATLAAKMFTRMDRNGDMVITIEDMPDHHPVR